MAAVKVTTPAAAPGSAGGTTYLVYDASGQKISFVAGVSIAGSKTILMTNHKSEQIMMTQQNVTDMLAVWTVFSNTGIVV